MLGLVGVVGCSLVLGCVLYMLVLVVLLSANLVHVKGVLPGQEPWLLDNFVDVILVACLVLTVFPTLRVYIRIWRRHRQTADGPPLSGQSVGRTER